MFDLDRAPYAEWRERLGALRRDPHRWPEMACVPTRDAETGTHDAHEQARARVVHLLYLDARPADLALIRHLLDAEIEARRIASWQGVGDVVVMLSILLVRFGDARDTLRFWRAKTANFDTSLGYDIEFVFAHLPPALAVVWLAEHGAEELDFLERYDLEELAADQPAWRARVVRRYIRDVAQMDDSDREVWAELFDDREAQAHYGLLSATDAQQRAMLYDRLDRPADALVEWRAAVDEAEEDWQRSSLLARAMEAAARAGVSALAEARALDAMRPAIEMWSDVGLSRIATEACYASAAAVDDPADGAALWALGQAWRSGLKRYPQSGLEAARRAAERWGTAADRRALDRAIAAEKRRIEHELGG